MSDEKNIKQIIITIDEDGYQYESALAKHEVAFWLRRLEHKVQCEMDTAEATPA